MGLLGRVGGGVMEYFPETQIVLPETLSTLPVNSVTGLVKKSISGKLVSVVFFTKKWQTVFE